MNAGLAYLRHKLWPRARRWDPMLAIYYLTWACDFRCPYCSDGQGMPYPAQSSRHIPAPEVLALFARLRRHCDNLELTGGEPLLHPQVDQVLDGLAQLDFREKILTTNGWHLDEHLERVGRALTTLVVSLDTLDPVRAEKWYGKGPSTLSTIVSTLEKASRLPRTRLVVSAVATLDNCRELPEVARFAWDLGATFACYPQLVGTTAPPGLAQAPGYQDLYRFLLAQKCRGKPVFATTKALEWMRDLADFPCRPSTLVAIAPNGDVLWPCLEIGKVGGNLFLQPDLNAIYRDAWDRLGSPPRCGNQCHSACSLGFSSILEHPSTLWGEVRGTLAQARARKAA